MLRGLVSLLILVNVVYWAWVQGLFADVGVWAKPQNQREPKRLEGQIKPDRIRLLAANAPEIKAPVVLGEASVPLTNTEDSIAVTSASGGDTATIAKDTSKDPAASAEPNAVPKAPSDSAATNAPSSASVGVCRQTAYFNEKDLPRIESLFKASLPEGTWAFAPIAQPARWIVYTGKLSGPKAVAETKAELRQLKISYRDVSAALQPGLALGTFSNEEAAQQGVRDVARNGYKGAEAVIERPEHVIYTLRLLQATDELKAKASAVLVKQGEAKAAKSWQSCSD
jgi:hypothetical protein